MRRIVIPAFSFFLLVVAACSSNSVDPEPDYVAGEVMISLAHGTTQIEAEDLVAEVGLEWKKYFNNLGVALVGVPPGEEQYWIDELESHPLIDTAQLNHTNLILR